MSAIAPDRLFSRRLALATIILLGLLVRLPFIIGGYHSSRDPETYMGWGRIAQSRGIDRVYDSTGVSYPPLLIYMFAGAVSIQDQVSPGTQTGPGGDRLAIGLVQTASVLADLAVAGLLAWLFWRRSTALAILVAALWLFNPVVWYVSGVWGQTDSIYALLLLGAVVALSRGAVIPAWFLYSLGLAAKLQSIALLPLMVVWTVARFGWRALLTGLLTAAAVGAVVFAPWLISGYAGDLVTVYTKPPESRVVTSAFNAWYLLLGGNLLVPSNTGPLGLSLSYETIGDILFAALAVVIMIMAVRHRIHPAIAAAALCLSMFVVVTQMHERHIYPALLFLCWAAAEQFSPEVTPSVEDGPKVWKSGYLLWLYVLLSAGALFNIIGIVPPSPDMGTSIITAPAGSSQRSVLLALSFFTALLNIVILGWLIVGTRWRRGADDRRPTTDDRRPTT